MENSLLLEQTNENTLSQGIRRSRRQCARRRLPEEVNGLELNANTIGGSSELPEDQESQSVAGRRSRTKCLGKPLRGKSQSMKSPVLQHPTEAPNTPPSRAADGLLGIQSTRNKSATRGAGLPKIHTKVADPSKKRSQRRTRAKLKPPAQSVLDDTTEAQVLEEDDSEDSPVKVPGDPDLFFFCCPKCSRYFPRKAYPEFREHISEECFVKKRLPCRLCGHIYSSQNILDYHMTHIHEKPHPKSKILRTRPRKEFLQYKIKLDKSPESDRTAPPSNVSPTVSRELEEDDWPDDEAAAERLGGLKGVWRCWICFYESDQRSLWNTHVNRIHPNAVGITFPCDHCKVPFRRKHHLREHLHEVHPEDSGFTCPDCGRKFLHRNLQHVCERIDCSICGATFLSRGSRSKHMLIHPEFRPHKCQLCPKEFQKREYLTIHMRVHNNLRPYPCEFCDKKFRSKSHYNNHKRLHTGEKPYICHSCGRSFFSPQGLSSHLTSHDGGGKTWVCGTCGKGFRTANDLKRHAYVHSGEKPHSCKYCGKSFNRRGNCLVHERGHALDGDFECESCGLKFKKSKKFERHVKRSHPHGSEGSSNESKVVAKTEERTGVGGGGEASTFIQVDDVASNVEIVEGPLVGDTSESVGLYQYSFEIDESTLYCVGANKVDARN